MTDTRTDRPAAATTPAGPATAYSVLMDLVLLGILSLAAMAGQFLKEDGARDDFGGYIDAHGLISEASEVLVFAAAVVALVKLRHHRALAIGTPVLLIAMLFNGYLGGAIRDEGKDGYTAVHVPLAIAITMLAAWLVQQGISLRRSSR